MKFPLQAALFAVLLAGDVSGAPIFENHAISLRHVKRTSGSSSSNVQPEITLKDGTTKQDTQSAGADDNKIEYGTDIPKKDATGVGRKEDGDKSKWGVIIYYGSKAQYHAEHVSLMEDTFPQYKDHFFTAVSLDLKDKNRVEATGGVGGLKYNVKDEKPPASIRAKNGAFSTCMLPDAESKIEAKLVAAAMRDCAKLFGDDYVGKCKVKLVDNRSTRDKNVQADVHSHLVKTGEDGETKLKQKAKDTEPLQTTETATKKDKEDNDPGVGSSGTAKTKKKAGKDDANPGTARVAGTPTGSSGSSGSSGSGSESDKAKDKAKDKSKTAPPKKASKTDDSKSKKKTDDSKSNKKPKKDGKAPQT